MFPKEWANLSLPKKIEKFTEWFPTITKEESDFIEKIASWDTETKAAFLLAKRFFEDPDE